ncbi:unnamed protein product [Cylindrotheca closterium]|uniref:Folate/biopterin transporter n=1 Tax=Cylindrotheca closterium TaxID=2856 RepID=A0AAD2FXA5_9STRA|nr:unnamed protein product [Cylindrotheca closterium]
MKDEHHDMATGISGPRRTTQEPLETAAANAEASRLADLYGVSSTSKRGPPFLRDNASPIASKVSTPMVTQRRGFGIRLFGKKSNVVVEQGVTEDYQALSPDTNPSGVTTANSERKSQPSLASVYSPPPRVKCGTEDEVHNKADEHSVRTRTFSVETGELAAFDANGNLAPYRDGPYDIHHDYYGRQIKRRWYGRLEDGYLAWSSIFLHENFGFTIYTPLTEKEEEKMRQNEFIPDWMEYFTSLPNLAIPISYFCIGVALQLLRTPLIVYFIQDLGASAAEVNVLFTVMAVPWCFKVLYGFLSDCLPISGLRRKPYFMAGWVVYIASNFALSAATQPSIGMCISLVFVQTAGYMLADVMTDALIVERSRYESEAARGTMQSRGYIVRFFGSMIGAAIGAVVYNKDTWEWFLPMPLIFFINGAVPLVILLPFVPYLLELENHCKPKQFWKQCEELFETVQLRSVWQPMTFVYVYNALQLTNAAWMNFLVEGLDFKPWMIGLVSVVGSIMAWVGIITYKKFFFASNWRVVYFWCTTLASAIALGQLILVFGMNRPIMIPDIVFSMGDDVLVEFVIAVQFLPMCIMYLGLCPPGSEGTTYALLTTWSNLAGSLAFDISTALTAIWDVSSETISEGDFSGVWKLSLLCGLLGPLPLVLLKLIPKNKEDQQKLQKDETRSYSAGVVFIFVMIVTLLITFVESVYEVASDEDNASMVADGMEGGDGVQRRLKRLLIGH